MRTARRTTWRAARLGMAAVAAGALVGRRRRRRGPRDGVGTALPAAALAVRGGQHVRELPLPQCLLAGRRAWPPLPFTLRNTAFPARLTPSQQHLAAVMKACWTDFAASGYPATAAGPVWPRFSSAGEQMLSPAAPRPSVETTFAAEHHCGFWAEAGWAICLVKGRAKRPEWAV